MHVNEKPKSKKPDIKPAGQKLDKYAQRGFYPLGAHNMRVTWSIINNYPKST